jgi:hypothetical protein
VKSLIDSQPDGYTLMLTANALAANMALYTPAPFDAEKDVTTVALVGRHSRRHRRGCKTHRMQACKG